MKLARRVRDCYETVVGTVLVGQHAEIWPSSQPQRGGMTLGGGVSPRSSGKNTRAASAARPSLAFADGEFHCSARRPLLRYANSDSVILLLEKAPPLRPLLRLSRVP